MQKRKSPVLLFGLVVIALGGMVVWNASSRPAGEEDHSDEDVSQEHLSAHEKESAKEDLLNTLPDTKGGGMPRAVMADQAPGAAMELAKKPTILLEKWESARPRPNDASTAAHWYVNESRSAKLSEENSRTRG